MMASEKERNEKDGRKSNMDLSENGQEQGCGTMPLTLQDVPVSEAVQRAHDELLDHWINISRAKERKLKKLRTEFLKLHLDTCKIQPTEGCLYRREIQQRKAAMIENKIRRLAKTTDFRWLEDGLISSTTSDSEREFLKKLKRLKKGLKFLGQFLPKCRTIFTEQKYSNGFGLQRKYPHLYRKSHLELIAKYCGFFGLKIDNVMGNHLFPEPDYVVTRKRRSGNIAHRAQFGDYLLDYTRCGTVHVLPRLSEVDEVNFGSVDEVKITVSNQKQKAVRQTDSDKSVVDNSKNCLKSLDPRLGNLKFTRRFESPSYKSKLPINESYLMRCNTEGLKLPKIQNAQRQQETGRLNIETAGENCASPNEKLHLNLGRNETVKLPKIRNTCNGEGNNGFMRTSEGKLSDQQGGSRPNRLQDGSGSTCRLPVLRNTNTVGSAPWSQMHRNTYS